MELCFAGIQNKTEWENAGVRLPEYNVRAAAEAAVREPRWVHFGAGNIFRLFIAGIADELLEKKLLDRGITCVEAFDTEIIDKIYKPYDNLVLSVILRSNGTRKLRILGSLAEAVPAADKDRLQSIFKSKALQLISFTVTEKGYALKGRDGSYLPAVKNDIENGPAGAASAMGIVCAGLLCRYRKNALPTALVSMDNCSQNGRLLKQAVTQIAREWHKRGFVSRGFLNYLCDSGTVSFNSTMIDKITPRPSSAVAKELRRLGINRMEITETEKHTFIAPFANGETAQYLVIEDTFPNGRPALEAVPGVYMGDFETVKLCERMKVTALLNPVHTATGPLGVVLGYTYFADMMQREPAIMKMAKTVAFDEGLPVITDPKILSPRAFADELFEERFVNPYLGDTNVRLCTDASQGVGVRFGETVKAYVKRDGSAEKLTAVPLGIAGWLRYMLGVDDMGRPYTLAPDPMNGEITKLLSTVAFGKPDTLQKQLRPLLSDAGLFGTDLYEAGLGTKIETMLAEMLCGEGAALKTVKKYMEI